MQRLDRLILALVVCLFFSVDTVRAEDWLFVSLLKDKKIVAFERDHHSGKLVRGIETECPAEPAFLAKSSDGRTLFVSLRSTGELASYRVDPKDGSLKLLSVVSGGRDPAYLQTDNSGRFLLTAYYAANKVTVHRILDGGFLHSDPLQTVLTAQRAHGVAFTSDNQSVLVPHTGANRIYVFGFDAESGKLAAANPEFFETPAALEPRHIMLHPSDRWAYTSDEKGDSVSMFQLEGGKLTLQQSVSTIPPDFDGTKNSTARCEMTPDGQFVYVANRGHDSIAGFAIDQSSGRLKSLGQTPTEKTPRSFTISADGRFLYAAGQGSGRVAAYLIGRNGKLGPVATYESGPVSWSVLSLETP